MSELKPEDVKKALAWYEVVGKNIGSVTIPYNELQAIAAQFREKDAKIAELQSIAEFQQSSNMKRHFELQEKDKQIAEKDAIIAQYILQIAEMQKQIATQDRELTALMQHKKIEADKDAEIERLSDVVNRLQKHNRLLCELEKMQIDNIKAEAITEFTEALKALQDPNNPWDTFQVSEEQITQIANSLKEKLDETNDY